MSEPFQLTPRIARQLPWLVAVAFFMQALDGTILNTALPSMASSLNENPLRMQAVVIAYLLTVALLIPASGGSPTVSARAGCSSARYCCSASARCFARCRRASNCWSARASYRASAAR